MVSPSSKSRASASTSHKFCGGLFECKEIYTELDKNDEIIGYILQKAKVTAALGTYPAGTTFYAVTIDMYDGTIDIWGPNDDRLDVLTFRAGKIEKLPENEWAPIVEFGEESDADDCGSTDSEYTDEEEEEEEEEEDSAESGPDSDEEEEAVETESESEDESVET